MTRAPSDRHLAFAIAVSALLHASLLALVPYVPRGSSLPALDAPLEVALLPPEPLKAAPGPAPRRMVAPPDQINDRAPENPRFQSDRDNAVEHETVNPGVPNPGPAVAPAPRPAAPPRPAAAERPPAAKARRLAERPPAPRVEPKEARPAPALDKLFASTEELVAAQRDVTHEPEEAAKGDTGRRKLALAVAPIAPDWSLPGTRGTLDDLPNIQRGTVTLLNTKANEFSPFVRRVGERVFQHLIIRQRRLELEQILSARSPVQMRAILDARGRLKSVVIEAQSGSASMDDTLSDALDTAAFDNNPPQAAAKPNGDFEFLFQAQLRAYQPGPGGSPGRIESRLSVALL
ncbi:MAG: hypothetical protein B6D46_08385 [Polyangiaceae bacterium UTPRO1]|jgi:hypothetical protein|nr:hypothetical protein [Myxococcales bacterium]OQY66963.1 MAG: hypothetical protein B6D46_08385 [Polyangiaceae bacterium UTPRO1]